LNTTLEQEKRHRCGHVVAKKIKRGHVYETTCDRGGAMPMFTRPVTSMTRTRAQPRWFCSLHWPKHVSIAFDGAPLPQEEFAGIYRGR